MRKANIIISTILIGFSAVYFYLITLLPDRNLPHTLGSDFVPRLLIICLFVLSVLMLLQGLFSKKTESEPVPESKNGSQSVTKILLTLSVITLYIILMIRFGYLIATPFFMIALLWLAGCRNYKHLIIIPIAVSFIVYYVFYNFFHVPLP